MILLLTSLLYSSPVLHNDPSFSEQLTPNTAPLSHSSQSNIPQTLLIQTDYTLLETLSLNNAKQALDFQARVMEAALDQNQNAIRNLMPEMELFIKKFNQDLNALPLKSIEVKSLREKMVISNQLSIEILNLSLAHKPDQMKLIELQKRANAVQHELLTETQIIKQKIAD